MFLIFTKKTKVYIGIGFGVGVIGLAGFKIYNSNYKAIKEKDLKGKIIIVTGASDGIGKETALQLLKRGAKVIFACRNEEKTIKIISDISNEKERKNAQYIYLDLSRFSSVVDFINTFKSKYSKLHYLINNAVTFSNEYTHTLDNMETTFQTNYYSPVVLSAYLLNSLKSDEGGRIINVSCHDYKRTYNFNFKGLATSIPETYKFERDSSWTNYRYDLTKSFISMFSLYLAEICDRKKLNIQVLSVNPGSIYNSSFVKNFSFIQKLFINIFWPYYWFFSKTCKKGAENILHCIDLDNNDIINGGYYSNCVQEELLEFIKNKDNILNLIKFTKLMIRFYGQEIGIHLENIFLAEEK